MLDRITMIVDDALEHNAVPPRAIFESDGYREMVEGFDMQYALGDYLHNRDAPKECVSSLLLDTRGGRVDIATPVYSNIDYLRWHGIPTIAFIRDDALSCGGELFKLCSSRIGLPHTAVMWHQIYYRSPDPQASGRTSTAPRYTLKFPRSMFRRQIVAWLAQAVKPDKCRRALDRAQRAFEDPKNHLDDIEFNGEELHDLGLMDHLAPHLSGLALHYGLHTRSNPEQWHPSIQAFFGGIKRFTL